MEIVTAREIRANQGKFLTATMKGHSVILTSRFGNFKITPITEDDSLTTRICRGLEQVKMIQDGKLPRRTVQDMLNEL